MTLRDLVLTIDADEKLMIRRLGESEMLECTPPEILNEYETLHDVTVSTVWVSYSLYKALMIIIE